MSKKPRVQQSCTPCRPFNTPRTGRGAKTTFLSCLVLAGVFCLPLAVRAGDNGSDISEQLKNSLVYLEVSRYGYNHFRPWRHTDISQTAKYGCAVGAYQVITTASRMSDVTLIKARRFDQNEFIPGRIKVIDYEANLCLIELDAAAMSEPLTALTFSEDYQKGAAVDCYWLSSDNHVYTGRGFMDRGQVKKSPQSFMQMLNYIIKNTSENTGAGELYCLGSKPIGLAGWLSGNDSAGLVPAGAINHFLEDVADDIYKGFPTVGFEVTRLLDPARRSYLKMPTSIEHGVYVSKIYTLGTGCDSLKAQDVILALDGTQLDSYGQFNHPLFEQLSFEHLITNKKVGDSVVFDIWRDGQELQIQVETQNFSASEMMVPYYDIDHQPEYLVIAGFVIQKLTRNYMSLWGDDWSGKVSSHLYNYYRDQGFMPTDDRKDIVLLSHVLPGEINLGYKNLRQLVVAKVNGMKISSIKDIPEALKLNPQGQFDIIEFENDNPLVVIPRAQLNQANAIISQNYGVTKLANIKP